MTVISMTRKVGIPRLTGLSFLALTTLSATVAMAEPVDVSQLDRAELRNLFHSPEYNKICPLMVYSEDISATAPSRRAALSPSPAPAIQAPRPEFSTIRAYLHSPHFVVSDGLVDYGDVLAVSEKL